MRQTCGVTAEWEAHKEAVGGCAGERRKVMLLAEALMSDAT